MEKIEFKKSSFDDKNVCTQNSHKGANTCKARFFLLVYLQDFFFRVRVGGTENKKI